MYTEASYSNSSSYARMQTDITLRHNQNQVCVRFWYHMYGASMGSLSVFYQEQGKRDKRVWNKTGLILIS